MTEWRFLRSWSSEELKRRIDRMRLAQINATIPESLMTAESGWRHCVSESLIARAAVDDLVFERAGVALTHYRFSDPRIVMAHFDPEEPLLGRRLLLEIKVLGLRYLSPAIVNRVREEPNVHGFRYDTLEGHIERGVEWFVLTRNAAGDIRFRIEARWQRGELPNWWSRAGFTLLSRHYQRRWHIAAHQRMSRLAWHGSVKPPRPDRSGLTHQGLDVTFTYGVERGAHDAVGLGG